jgi:putative hemolysin
MVHLDSLLEQFRQSHSQIAIVIDEHGGTAGLVTLEDVVEEVFGELHDALEAEQPRIQPMEDGRILVRGDVRLDELHDFSGWALEDPDADTIAGYVMHRLGRTAHVGDVVETTAGVIRVENMARHRITQVALIPARKDADDSDDGAADT